jgi:hypothetical protein
VSLFGPKLTGGFAPDIPLDKQRKAENVYEQIVGEATARLESEGRVKETRRSA